MLLLSKHEDRNGVLTEHRHPNSRFVQIVRFEANEIGTYPDGNSSMFIQTNSTRCPSRS